MNTKLSNKYIKENMDEAVFMFALFKLSLIHISAALPMLPSVPGAPLSLSDISTKLLEGRAHTGA